MRGPRHIVVRAVVVRAVVAGAVVAVVVGAAGCGATTVTVRSGSPPSSVTAAESPSLDPGAASNQQAAAREASRLLSLVRLPDGAGETGNPPKALAQPVLGVPAAESLVDKSGYWTVAMPFGQALAWMKAHPPHGLAHQGPGSGGFANAPQWSGDTYSAPASDTWQTAELEVAVAPDGKDRSAIRADGVVVWLDPTPMRDAAQGQRLHVDVDGPCPPSVFEFVGVTNSGSELTSRLLPGGQPTAGLVCEYSSGQENDGRVAGPSQTGLLRTQRALDADQARRISSAVKHLSLSHVGGASYDCPAGMGSATIIAFRYPRRNDIDVWLSPTGCTWIANGYIETGLGDVQKVVDSTHS